MLILSDRLEDLAPATSALLGLLFPLRYVLLFPLRYFGCACNAGLNSLCRCCQCCAGAQFENPQSVLLSTRASQAHTRTHTLTDSFAD